MTASTRYGVGHVGLNVSDLARSSQFYQQALDLQVVKESITGGKRYAFLSDGQITLTLWEQSVGQFEKTQPGLHHLAFMVGSLSEVEQAEQRLQAMNAKFIYAGIVPHTEGAKSSGVFFEDPDGIRLEIYTPSGTSTQPAPVEHGPSCGFF